MNCDGLLDRLGFDCRLVGSKTIAVGTPFLFADGEPIGFYLDDDGNSVSISDNADTLFHLMGMGLELSDRRNWKGIRQAIKEFGFELRDNGEIVGTETKSKQSELITRYIGAVLAVVDIERDFVGLTIEQSEFVTEVEMYLKASNPQAPFLLLPKAQGHSGRIHTFHFDFDNQLVEAARPHGNRTGAILRKSLDVLNAGYRKTILIVMDDREDPERAKIETDILSTAVSVLPFTRLVEQSSGNLHH